MNSEKEIQTKEFQYFVDHQDEIVRGHEGKFVAIKDDRILGYYDTMLEAYAESLKKFEAGTFLIQPCAYGPGAYTQTFHSGLVFGHN